MSDFFHENNDKQFLVIFVFIDFIHLGILNSSLNPVVKYRMGKGWKAGPWKTWWPTRNM